MYWPSLRESPSWTTRPSWTATTVALGALVRLDELQRAARLAPALRPPRRRRGESRASSRGGGRGGGSGSSAVAGRRAALAVALERAGSACARSCRPSSTRAACRSTGRRPSTRPVRVAITPLRVGRDQLRPQQHRVDIFFGVVVGEDRAAQVGGGAGGAQVARGGEDRVDRVVGVGVAGVEGVHAVLQPGVGHELHPADRAGARDRQVGAVVGLDFVDRRRGSATARRTGRRRPCRSAAGTAACGRRRAPAAEALRGGEDGGQRAVPRRPTAARRRRCWGPPFRPSPCCRSALLAGRRCSWLRRWSSVCAGPRRWALPAALCFGAGGLWGVVVVCGVVVVGAGVGRGGRRGGARGGRRGARFGAPVVLVPASGRWPGCCRRSGGLRPTHAGRRPAPLGGGAAEPGGRQPAAGEGREQRAQQPATLPAPDRPAVMLLRLVRSRVVPWSWSARLTQASGIRPPGVISAERQESVKDS